jgi:hypothetical protein
VSDVDPKDDQMHVDPGLFAGNRALRRRDSALSLYVGIPIAVVAIVGLVVWIVSISHRPSSLLTNMAPAPPAPAYAPPRQAAPPQAPAPTAQSGNLAEAAPPGAAGPAVASSFPRREHPRTKAHRRPATSSSTEKAQTAESGAQEASALERMSAPPPTLNLPSAHPPPLVEAPPANR